MVLQRLFDIIRTLAKSSLALRGHRKDLSQKGYHGNFLSFVELVARYDHILRRVFDMPRGSTRYFSATIQNEMIESMGNKLETLLLEQIRASLFFAIIMDTTQDISKSKYLHSVQQRYRWTDLRESPQVRDSVLIKQDNVPPSSGDADAF
ncbi:52 kDa repressor of the inhibitor of the protein kinase [Eumeta japonica]|uniref:52 kDa repressor of the inhibitor of the protein kinase n=1 Tax=Eumeta variegata TaxID=151549 RepID=A0A4C1ZB13_EUMVA|nr:52 kDa repressor of the inhibitor of the protein kinase [Eumeta japonica]